MAYTLGHIEQLTEDTEPGTCYVQSQYATTFVAVVGHVQDYAVYAGTRTLDSDDVNNWKYVAKYGDKVSQGDAERLFPRFKQLDFFYRR